MNEKKQQCISKERVVDNSYRDTYVCKICSYILEDPVQTPNGNLACKECYERGIKSKNICPLEGESNINCEYFLDRHTAREVKKLKCYCIHSEQGCSWIGELGLLNKHEEECEYQIIKCKQCSAKLTKKELIHHETHTCPNLKPTCVHCGETLPVGEKLLHERSCPERLVDCIFQCQQSFRRNELASHYKKCPIVFEGTQCPFKAFGCTAEPGKDYTLVQHLEKEIVHHLNLVLSQVTFLKNDNDTMLTKLAQQTKTCQNLEDQLARYISTVDETKKEIVAIQKEKENLTASLNELEKSRESLLSRIDALEKYDLTEVRAKFEELDESRQYMQNQLEREGFSRFNKQMAGLGELKGAMDTCKSKVDEIEARVAVATADVYDVNSTVQQLRLATYNGHFIWKVDNVRLRMKQAKEGKNTALHSAPFYSKHFGYKFCLRLYLNGDGMGKGDHVSLFLVVMRSQHDALLPWPVEKRIKFRLFNGEGKNKMETFLTDKKSASFQRPQREVNTAIGCPKFISQVELLAGSYIMDDCLFFEAQVVEQ